MQQSSVSISLSFENQGINPVGDNAQVTEYLKEICPRGNNKVVIYISLYHDKCLLFMLELY